MSKNDRFILSVIFLLAAAGFLLPFWPLTVLAVLVAAFLGHIIFAVLLGILLDVAYGPPMGIFHYLFFPFTILACAGILCKKLALKYLLGRNPPEMI